MMAITRVILLLLYMISLPFELHGAPPQLTEQDLQRYLSRVIRFLTNDDVQLRSLYGDRVNVHNFNPGQRLLNFFDTNPDAVLQFDFSRAEVSLDDLHSDVEFDYIERATERIAEQNLAVLRGGPGSGKTRAMRLIEMGLNERAQPILAVYIDLPSIIQPNSPAVASSADLLQRSIPGVGIDQFVRNVAEINPSRVRILIDNFDRIPLAQREPIINAISELRTAQVGVTVSSTADVVPTFRQHMMNPIKLKIPFLTEMNFERFAENYYRRILGEEFIETNLDSSRSYIKALRLIAFETPLPRSIALVKKLIMYCEARHLQPLPTLREYIQLQGRNPRALLQLSDNINFNKMRFYRELLREPTNREFHTEVYGVEAVKMLLGLAVMPELTTRSAQSTARIQEFGEHSYKLMTFNGNHEPVEFLNREYMRFFAAEYIANSLKGVDQRPLTESFKAIIRDPRHSMVVEYINFEIGNLNILRNRIKAILSQMIHSSPDINVPFQIADNLIAYRFDNLAAQMLQALQEANLLNNYINNRQITIESKNKYSLGILAEPTNFNNHYRIPRRTPWMYRGTRMEMIVNLKLVNSRAVLQLHHHNIDPSIDLIAAAKEPQGLSQFLDAQTSLFIPNVLDRAMYECITHLGPAGIENMRLLKARGARPTAINVNGRTLGHEAARWHNRELLRVVREEFQVSLYDGPDAGSQTILFELLDHALPSNYFLEANAWDSVEYLTANFDMSGNEEIINQDLLKFSDYNPPLDIIKPSYQLLIADDGQNPDARADVLDTVENFIPIEDVDLPRNVLATRRMLIIKNCVMQMLSKPAGGSLIARATPPDSVAIAEIILSHEPIEGASYYLSYENTVRNLLTKNIRSFNRFQIERVSNIMAKSMYEAAHIIEMTRMVRSNVPPVQVNFLQRLKTAFENRIARRFPQASINEPFESRVVQTVYDVHADIHFDDVRHQVQELDRAIRGIEEHEPELSSSSDDELFCNY